MDAFDFDFKRRTNRFVFPFFSFFFFVASAYCKEIKELQDWSGEGLGLRVGPIHLCGAVVWGLSRLSLSRSASCSNADCFLSKYDTEVLDER